jgi:hypothetical protein
MDKNLFESTLIAMALTVLIFMPIIGFISAQSYFDRKGAANNGVLDGVQVWVTGWYYDPGYYYQTSHTAQRWAIYPVVTHGPMYSLFTGQGYSSEAYTSGNRVWSHYGDTTWAMSYASSGFQDESTGDMWAREIWVRISR